MCRFLEFFWSAFSRIQSISPYSDQMQEHADQKTPNTDIFHAVKDSNLVDREK